MSDEDAGDPDTPELPRHRNAPKPLGERRARRELVERMLAEMVPRSRIEKIVRKKFEAAPETIGDDIRFIRQKWRVSDGRNTQYLRRRWFQTMLAILRGAFEDGDYKTALGAQALLGQVLGIVVPGGRLNGQLGSEADAQRQQNLADLLKRAADEERIKAADVVPPPNGNGKHSRDQG